MYILKWKISEVRKYIWIFLDSFELILIHLGLAVEEKVIREVLKDMVLVTNGIVRIHVTDEMKEDFETLISQGNLLWYHVNENTRYNFKILNMIDATTKLELTVQQGHNKNRRVTETENKYLNASREV